MKSYFLSIKERFLFWMLESKVFIEEMMFLFLVCFGTITITLLLSNLFILILKTASENVWKSEALVVFLYGLIFVRMMNKSRHEPPVIKTTKMRTTFWLCSAYFLIVNPGLVALTMFHYSQRVMLRNYWQYSWPSLLTLLGTHILGIMLMILVVFMDEMKIKKVSEY